MHKQLPQIGVASLADAKEAGLTAGRVLSRHKSKPGGELPAFMKGRSIPDVMNMRISICTLITGLICPFTQAARGKPPGPVKPPPSATIVERPNSSAGGRSESDVANANNPIAPMNALYFQNYYAPTAYSASGPSNLLDLRSVVVSGRQIIRATLPVSSDDFGSGDQQSGLGDINVFDAIRLSPKNQRMFLPLGQCW